ncbi:NAD(P)-dependent oxidoreductase [Chitiniphilus purpureus]|uniref:NAD(P)-dependent oxidoreductase n=1 Tax=Chitiniphilus purpureus TaxID=2981137 RepID=A0ABY6DND1_9NEIS|nr:NAD(P)-dependent oxidoreductase [Chitiniphilus sp. CD1]UXY15879.1 NAD(P)-dependent oxidoreductase [Chitiniphilus sp. CD1]
MNALRETARQGKRVLLTGGTGYLGALLAAQVLGDDWADTLVVPSRQMQAADAVPEAIQRELLALGADPAALAGRIEVVGWQGAEHVSHDELVGMLTGVDTVIHCAGCLDYFDSAALQTLNVEFTQRLVDAAKAAGVGRFVFISTAYAGGYSGAPIPERALHTPPSDPTDYTLTKRNAEHVVACSGIPFLVVRPSIVIGSAKDGRYSGKRYGLYQQWMGIERLLSDRYHEELHTVATDQPLNLLHQDVFQAAMASILRWVPDGEYVNLVVSNRSAPSMKRLWQMICEVTRPRSVVFYDHMRQVDLKAIHMRQRAYLTFAQTNLEIGAYPWQFERGWLEQLAQRGLTFTETTAETIQICQDRFVRSSALLQRYLERFGNELPACVDYRQHDEHVPTLSLSMA